MNIKNNKGFTLVELLAVISILAILALITIPIIVSTVGNSQRNAAQVSAEKYIEAVKIKVTSGKINGNKVEDGNYCVGKTTQCDDGNIGSVKVTGTKPTEGNITVQNLTVTNAILVIDGYRFEYNGDKVEYSPIEE